MPRDSNLREIKPQIDAVAQLVTDLPGSGCAPGFSEAMALEQSQCSAVARIDVGLELGRAPRAPVRDEGNHRLAGIALSPLGGIEQEAELRQFPCSQLADQATVQRDD